MQYEIKRDSKLKRTMKKIHSAAEDCFLSVVVFLAGITKSEKLSNWIESYTRKKIQKMQSEIIRMKWDNITLQKAKEAINEQQNIN